MSVRKISGRSSQNLRNELEIDFYLLVIKERRMSSSSLPNVNDDQIKVFFIKSLV